MPEAGFQPVFLTIQENSEFRHDHVQKEQMLRDTKCYFVSYCDIRAYTDVHHWLFEMTSSRLVATMNRERCNQTVNVSCQAPRLVGTAFIFLLVSMSYAPIVGVAANSTAPPCTKQIDHKVTHETGQIVSAQAVQN